MIAAKSQALAALLIAGLAFAAAAPAQPEPGGVLTPLELGPPPDPSLVLFAGSPENFARLMAGLTRGLPITLEGAAPGPASAVTFSLPLPPVSQAAAGALLERARLLLSREAIAAPTPLQLRAALLAVT